ncbi:neuronal acetylcholine receptor subunit alpha-7-like [Strix uralensis]|uniref:neuronal acetylcholine receptor subunit alpha-7-like n=1 Tax=Strix uralensis TaxID=36305 RepID=UPI003DA78B86
MQANALSLLVGSCFDALLLYLPNPSVIAGFIHFHPLLRKIRQPILTMLTEECLGFVCSGLYLWASLFLSFFKGILKSTRYIDVCWFPFSVQKCDLKFGSWTHSGWLIDLQMLEADISNYISNGERDLMGKRNEMYYECCKEPYPDVMYTITMCQHTLYYVLNLLIPCLIISGLALLDFLLPADSGEKISLGGVLPRENRGELEIHKTGPGIPVLLSLTVFMLPVADIMPATSQSHYSSVFR